MYAVDPASNSTLILLQVPVANVPQFTCLDLSLRPPGLWRTIPEVAEDTAFAYSSDESVLDRFKENVKAAGGVYTLTVPCPGLSVVIFEGIVWDGSVWASETETASLVFTVYGLRDAQLPYHLGWVKTNVAESDGTFALMLPPQLVHPSVTHVQRSPYIDFYCTDLDYCRHLVASGFYDREHNFGYEHLTQGIQSKLVSDPCRICHGVHRNICPFLRLLTRQTYRPDLDMAKNYFASGGSLYLEREDLARSAIEFVKQKHLLLVSGVLVILVIVFC